MRNVYNTTDPSKLLELKRLEADALLDVLRTINSSEIDISRLCRIARNVLRAQLGVKKVIFYYEYEGSWVEGMRMGFDPMELDALEELIHFKKTTKVTSGFAPFLMAMGAEYVIPIINRGEPSAYFVIADFADTEMEVQNDLIFIATLGNILNVAIRNRQLISDRVRQEYLRRELKVAETIQKQLLLSDFERFREIDVYGFNVPHHRIGGDFYDVIKKGKGTTFVCIADVAGKGIAAALLMSNLQANLRALCAQYNETEQIIHELNKIIFNITQGERFVTLFLARIDSLDQQLNFVNAGHNYPLFLHQEQALELKTGSMLLGIMPEIGIQSQTLAFDPGDNLFMYTDGVVEQMNQAEELFGTDRIISALLAHQTKSAREVTTRLYHDLNEFSNGEDSGDDVTMLHVKFLPN
jgi:sigma-B regulation protein RsbU (phosphoserine phosphatase)